MVETLNEEAKLEVAPESVSAPKVVESPVQKPEPTPEPEPKTPEPPSKQPPEQSFFSKYKKVFAFFFLLVLGVVGIVFWQFPNLYKGSSKSSYVAPKLIKVVVSLPIKTSAAQAVRNSVILAFEEADNQIDGIPLELVVLDDGDETGIWNVEYERENAQTAADNSEVLAYFGAHNSGATKVSVPITNEAGMAQISASSTWPGLTKSGFFSGEPDVFYPTNVRNFFRVNTTDDLQGAAAASWARELGFESVYIIDDGEAYGKGIADIFRKEARKLGIDVLGQKLISRNMLDFASDIEVIKRLNPDLVYYGGTVTTSGPLFLKQMHDLGMTTPFMGPDGILSEDLFEFAGEEATEGIFITTIGAPILEIGTKEADDYYQNYLDRFGVEPEVFGAFGYEAAKVLLYAIENAPEKTRAGVLQELKNISNFEGLFGSWSFDKNGDTSMKFMSGNTVKDGKFEFVKILKADSQAD